jgi:hypothetical protein
LIPTWAKRPRLKSMSTVVKICVFIVIDSIVSIYSIQNLKLFYL